MTPDTQRRETLFVLSYFFAYFAYLFLYREGEILHWVGLVLLPLGLLWLVRRPARLAELLASVGIARDTLTRGVGWAILIGLLLSALQLSLSRQGRAIAELLLSPRALYLLPLSFGLMCVTAAFTEEFFFRGILQTRLAVLCRSNWLAVAMTSVLFGFYHLPYAYLHPRWPSHGNWGEAFASAFGQAVPMGLILGALFVRSRSNLFACVILHALINTFPALASLAKRL